jgi:hypothetical protein
VLGVLWDTLKSPPELVAQESVVVGQNNQPPAIVDETLEITPNETALLDVLSNDSDPENGALTLVFVEPPRVGRATIVNDGGKQKIAFTPPSGFSGQVILVYTVRDTAANERQGRVTVQVPSLNYFPIVTK